MMVTPPLKTTGGFGGAGGTYSFIGRAGSAQDAPITMQKTKKDCERIKIIINV